MLLFFHEKKVRMRVILFYSWTLTTYTQVLFSMLRMFRSVGTFILKILPKRLKLLCDVFREKKRKKNSTDAIIIYLHFT